MRGGSHRVTLTPYATNSEGDEFAENLISGGDVVWGIASQAMKLGDAVFLTSTKDTFNKSVTVANYATLVGVVVAGKATDFGILQDDALIGVLTVAQATERIGVLIWGVAKVAADAALATIGTKLTGAATTAGRVGSVGAASGNFIGVQLDVAAGAASVIRLGVGYAG